MDKTQFWALIEASRNKKRDCEKQAQKLRQLLSQLNAEDIIEFDRIFGECSDLLYRWDLWAVAYIVNGGASDDGFQYFRWWIIGQGREHFEATIENVERAADGLRAKDGGGVECEEIAYCINHAYREKIGNYIPRRTPNENSPVEPTGEPWKEEDLETLFPALCEKFG